uniref:Fibronectin type 3 and ankyrin repeat domains 1 protein n=1 Tax=Cacopsylla melanoneura TaxID=428564 RepID=A0A8D9BPD3_9HEMI
MQVLCSEEMYAHTADDFMSVTTFHRAIQYGDLNDIRKFVRERKNLIDVHGAWGETALIKASRQGKADIVDYLLKSGADVNKVSEGTDRTALMVAVIHGHLNVVEVLNEKGCDWSVRDRTRCQAVHFVCTLDSRHFDLVHYVLKQSSIQIDAQDCTGCTVLMKSVTLNAPIEIIKKILDSGANPNLKSNYGITALMTAVLNSNAEAVSLLLASGANPDDVTGDNVSTMTLAESIQCQNILEQLLEIKNNPPPPAIILHDPTD